MKKVCGLGVTDEKTRENGSGQIKSYIIWRSMLRRCYSDKLQAKQPTYIGCSVCSDWLLFSNFKAWYDKHYREGYQLDKDILNPGNKVYSPENCRFIPRQVNSLILDSCASRGKYMIGVCFDNNANKFKSQCHIFNPITNESKLTYLGLFTAELEAHLKYKEAKEQNVKIVAEYYYQKSEIDVDVYKALLNWTVK